MNGDFDPTTSIVQYTENGPVKHYPFQDQGDASVKSVFPNSVALTPFYSKTLNGDYEAAGIGLANFGVGDIAIATPPAGSTIEDAFLFWDVIRFGGSDLPINPNGTLNGQPVIGTTLGTADVGGIPIDGFVANVTSIARFGTNNLTGFSTGAYQTDGASLVVVYRNPILQLKTVVINDGIEVFNYDTVSTTLQNFKAGMAPITAKTTYMAGQLSYGRDEALFNGVVVGTGVFNENSGSFWSNVNIDVSALVNPGDTTAEAGINNMQNNVLVWVAQAFSVNAPAPSRGIDIKKYNIYSY